MPGGGRYYREKFRRISSKGNKIRRNYKANFSAGEDCMQKIEVLY